MADAKETKPQKTKQTALYSKAELIAAARQFGVSQDIMAGALRLAGKETLTREEAEKAIQDYGKRKV